MKVARSIPKFTIQRVGADDRTLRWVGLVVLGLVLLIFGYWVGSYAVSPGLSAALARAGLEDRRTEQEGEVERLTARLAIAERSQQVAEVATEQLRQELVRRDDELRDLRSELAFYRGILTERGSEPGLKLHGFDMDPATGRLELVLVRGRADGTKAEGNIEIRLVETGMDYGSEDELYGQLAPLARVSYAFEFFQRLDMPIGVHKTAGLVLVTLLPGQEKAKPVHYLRSWPAEGSQAVRDD